MNPQIFITVNIFASVFAFLIYTYLLLNYNNECSDKNMFIKLRTLVLLSIIILFISILSRKLSDKLNYFLLVIPVFGIAKFLLFMNVLFNFKNCEIYNSERVIFSTIAAVVVLLCSLGMIFYVFYTKKVLTYSPRGEFYKVLNSHKNFKNTGPGSTTKQLTEMIVNESTPSNLDNIVNESTPSNLDNIVNESTSSNAGNTDTEPQIVDDDLFYDTKE